LKEKGPTATEQRDMDIELILWLLALFFPQLEPLRKGKRSRQKRARPSSRPRPAAQRPVGVGISWCYRFEPRDP